PHLAAVGLIWPFADGPLVSAFDPFLPLQGEVTFRSVSQISNVVRRGSRRWKNAPCFSPGEAHRRPPCSSIIVRHNDRPRPVPVAFVVKNASKTCSNSSGGIPTPVGGRYSS